ncbi:16S rRNA (cytosine(967)-C(5))-methyltransferase RsmB [Thalassomonas sp. RHCl1]|uniref:16S rRNA (cytosine(967)-C(5))-methyltransferase RsmB n=1 Tax=Thalassomonas sp. RHCl1 TaxID=2995320 RepID=UPI00248B1BE6|nr:16S rRNA (cytosine(967)-C(5))-methyltransferase RsmB [Thalassomonas sp. RHCl1]
MNIRALAAKCSYAVIDQGRSLADELPRLQAKVEGKDKGLLQEITYGVLRYLPELEYDVRQLMAKPLTGKQRVCHFLILVGIYQIKYTRIPDHAAVSETVAATGPLKNRHLKGLINGVLRNYQRQQEKQEADNKDAEKPDSVRYNHPGWLLKKLQAAYPEKWQAVLAENQQKPPMWLRVNKKHHELDVYLTQLEAAEIAHGEPESQSGAIPLTSPVDVNRLPGFADGDVSIQDGAAQQAARLLDSQPGDHVLDCCAAPGGKTCHILEYTQDLASVTAIDIEESRLVRVKENLERLKLEAKVIAADAADPGAWWDKQLFDRILLDAPCSGTGVIRRHPDIKWLRKASDIPALTVLQQQILKNIWSLLKPGGTLIYATCSILPEENKEQIKQFLAENNDAELIPLPEAGDNAEPGWQILPGDSGMDGFYYAKLMKKA